jgi:thioredoxin 2
MAEDSARRATIACAFCGKLNRVDLRRVADRPRCGECGRPMLLDRPVKVSDQNLDRMIADAEVPVLVDFYADWCGPCKIMAPVLDEIARERAGEALIAKLDTDRNPDMSARFGIGGIPTLVVFRGGREIAREVGAIPKPRLEALIQRAASLG